MPFSVFQNWLILLCNPHIYLRLVAGACRGARRTFLLHYPPRYDARRDKPRQLNVNIAKQNEPSQF